MSTRRLRAALILALCISSLALLLLHAPPPVRSAGTIHVDAQASGTNDGSSWANAYTALQTALGSATSGDQIWIAEGVYKPGPAGSRSATFTIPDGVKVYGGFGGGEVALDDRDAAAHPTVLSGDIDTNDSVDADGVTISAANISGSNAYHVVTVSGVGSETVLDGVIITGGDARSEAPSTYGGGLHAATSNLLVTNVAFRGNAASRGGGMSVEGGAPRLHGVTLTGNLATSAGGAICNISASTVVERATMSYNQASNGGAAADYTSSITRYVNVIYYGNTASTNGGALYANSSSIQIADATLAGNSANGATSAGGGGYAFGGATYALVNTILWGNSATEYPQIGGATVPSISYSIVQGGAAGDGNMASDPLFVDLATADLRLGEGSPAIDAGSDADVPAGVTTDLAGNPRFVDGDDDGTATVDMGAYEYGTASAATTLTVGNEDVVQRGTVRVPVTIELAGAEVYAADLVLSYDSTRLTAAGVELGSASSGWLLEYNVSVPGEIRAHLAGGSFLSEDGELIVLVFAARDIAGAAPITWVQASLNEDGVATTLVDGGVTVYEPAGADFSGTPTSGPAPLTVNFTSLATGEHDAWSWAFGDGGTSMVENPSHTYLTPGRYTVSLTVSGPFGEDTEPKADYITVYTPAVAGFTASVVDGLAPLEVAFTDTSTGDINSWTWSFGDGNTSTVRNPTHVYTSAGTYIVSQTVSGNGGTSTETKTDLITVRLGEISGTVRYWTADRPVPGVAIALSGGASAVVVTDAAGDYAVSDLYRGDYSITPGQGADAGDAISPYDASLALRKAANLDPLGGYALQAADVTLNGSVTAYDASYILRVAALADPPGSPNADAAWQFDPETRDHTGFVKTVTGQNYVAVLLGDISGNWGSESDPTGQAARPVAELEWQVGPADASGLVTATLSLISSEAAVYSIRLDLGHDSSARLGQAWAGDRTSGWLLASNPATEGGCRVVMAGAQPVEAPGTLVHLRFQLPVGTSRLDATPSAELDEGTVAVRWQSQGDGHLVYLPLVRR